MDVRTRALVVAGGLLSAALAAGCAAHSGSAPRASVQACTAFGISAIEHHTTVTKMPAACQGLSRADVNFAMGRAIFEVAGSGQHKAVWRRQAAAEGARLAKLIVSLPRTAAGPHGGSVPEQGSPASSQGRALGVITLASWLVSASSGALMLGTWIARGGPRQQRGIREGLPPAVIFGHFGLALTGLVLWVSFLATGVAALAWTAAGLLMPVVGLGISTLTLWTPYPTHGTASGSGPPDGPDPARHPGSLLGTPAEDAIARRVTDDVFASALTDDEIARRLTEEVLASALSDPSRAGRRPKGHLAALVPAIHGMAAVTTILFALLTAISTR